MYNVVWQFCYTAVHTPFYSVGSRVISPAAVALYLHAPKLPCVLRTSTAGSYILYVMGMGMTANDWQQDGPTDPRLYWLIRSDTHYTRPHGTRTPAALGTRDWNLE
jgi:hypothetical protein